MKNQKSHSIIKFIFITIILFSFSSATIMAQTESNAINMGEIVSIDSKVLGEQRDIYVFVPFGYNQSAESYPVIYVTDGRANFFYSAAIVNFLARNQRMPRSIVIGIPNTNRMRDFTPVPTAGTPASGGADKFLEFMEKELIPYVNKNFRTQQFSTFFGHSLCGMFAVYALFEKPGMFDAYIAVSPYLQYEDQYVIDRVESALNDNPDFDEQLYITIGDEPAYTESLERLENILSAKAENLSWTLSKRENEDHGSVPLKSLYDGLEFIYSGWMLTNEAAMKGADVIRDHYSRLSDKYGFPVKIEEAAANMIGYRLMQNDELDKAIEVFKYNVQLYPESANVYDSLGEALEKAGETEAAADNYRAAVKFGSIINDPNLDIYKRNLARVETGG